MKPEELIILKILKRGANFKKNLEKINRKVCKKFKLPLFKKTSLLKAYRTLLKKKVIKKNKILEKILITRPVRSLSGIVNVSVLTKPFFCPEKCIFCPTEKNFPKSYLSGEPAADRAKEVNFNPYLQVEKRIKALSEIGHPTSKIELRIIGGSFSVYPKAYRRWFLKRCFDGANGIVSKTLKEAQRRNEKAKRKIVGLSIETRPDLINEKEIKFLRELGITLVEMGVQTVFDRILKLNKTSLSREKITRATKILKDAGFKVLYQMMVNLYGSNISLDKKAFREIFENENFRPDWLKIYPCLVLKNSFLYSLFKKKIYQNYSEKELIELLISIKKISPFWIRITRIFRDIPQEKIISGSKISNLREIIQKEMKKRNLFCQCIRCREVREKYRKEEKIYLFRKDYQASSGKEIFLSFENRKRDKLYAYLRLRIPSFIFEKKKPIFKVLDGASLIREMQTLGRSLQIGKKGLSPQHKGLGKKLIKKAEKISKQEFSLSKIAVISGIGAREYFRKLSFKLKETYMIKKLS